MKTLLAVLLSLGLAGCSNIVLSNNPRDQLYPSFNLIYEGPIAYENKKAVHTEGDCVFDVKVDYPGSIIRNGVIPMRCTGSASETGLPWPPRGDLIVTWRATPDGELLRRQIDLTELGTYQIKGGSVTVKLVRDKLQLYLAEPDLRPGKCWTGSGVCQKLPKNSLKNTNHLKDNLHENPPRGPSRARPVGL